MRQSQAHLRLPTPGSHSGDWDAAFGGAPLGYESLSVLVPSPNSGMPAGALRRTTRGKATPGDRASGRTPWVLLQDFQPSFAQNLTAMAPGRVAQRASRRHGYRINFAMRFRRTIWSGASWKRHWSFHLGGYCSDGSIRGRASRTQVPERHEKSEYPVPDSIEEHGQAPS